MENTSHTDTIKVVGALLVGAALGAAIGILFAPAKGSDTRKSIMRKGEDLTDMLKEKLNEVIDSVTKESEKVVEKTKPV